MTNLRFRWAGGKAQRRAVPGKEDVGEGGPGRREGPQRCRDRGREAFT